MFVFVHKYKKTFYNELLKLTLFHEISYFFYSFSNPSIITFFKGNDMHLLKVVKDYKSFKSPKN